MQFELDESQTAVDELAAQILSDRSTPERLKEIEAGTGFDESTWDQLTKAGLLGLAVPEHLGGGGLGLVEAGLVARAVGRWTAAIPYRAAVVGALALADAGRDEAHLAAESGDRFVFAAEIGFDAATETRPLTRGGSGDGEALAVSGELSPVAFGTYADGFVLGVGLDSGDSALVFIRADAPGVELLDVETTTGLPASLLRLHDAEAHRIGGQDALERAIDRLRILDCMTMAGVCDGALALASTYTSEREQFGSKIGTFQAVAHRLADAYIDAQAIHLTALQTAWRFDEGFSHQRELAAARFWTAEGGQRVVHATQHVHGGIGVDIDYPQHRYFRWAKELELEAGGAGRSLVELGRALAGQPIG